MKMNVLKKKNKCETVKVIVRCRPMSHKEVSDGHKHIIDMCCDRGTVEIINPNNEHERKQYSFDAVYDYDSKQTHLYDEIFRPLVSCVLKGFNGTIFAYGQTGTGKTYTMEGIRNDRETRGVIPNSFEQIFNCIANTQHQQYLVRSSYIEIYEEVIRDLLVKDHTKRLELKERPDIGVYVKDLSSIVCKSIKEIEHVMNVGNQSRAVGSTNMNDRSSRSHTIFIITIEHSQMGIDGENHIRVGKLNLVDLAGSERQSKTGAVGLRYKESIKINLSLSALGNVISALIDGKSRHIPYRDSKLTRLLQDSLGGNAKTVMIANIGPSAYNYQETLTTLRYANRAKNIKNKPRVNENPKDALLREFQCEIERLKQQLMELRKRKENRLNNCINNGIISKSPDTCVNYDHESMETLNAKIRAMESKLLCGSNIIDHTNAQQIELEKNRQELAEQKRREREMRQKLEEHEERTMDIIETFTSLQHEVEIKRRKFRKLITKLQSIKTEVRDVREANAYERREYEQLHDELMKELKSKHLVIDNFIQTEDTSKMLNRVIYDNDEDNWKLLKTSNIINKRPVSSEGYRYPVSDYAVVAATLGSSPRYKNENIYDCKLDMPKGITCDYNVTCLTQWMKAALGYVLKNEDNLHIDIGAALRQNGHFSAKIKRQSGDDVQNKRSSPVKGSQKGKMTRNLSLRPDTANHHPPKRESIRK